MSQSAELVPVYADPSDPSLPDPIRQHLAQQLRALYGPVDRLADPAPFETLLAKLDAVLAARGEALTAEVRAGLAKAMPNLLAFALSLARDRARADDLVQDTLMKAWRRQPQARAGG